MVGDMISRVRKEKGVTKTKLSQLTEINIGHLTHIEKGERNPSHKALKLICSALKIPYQPLLYTYDKTLTQEQKEYNYIKNVSYNTIPAISVIDDYIACPPSFSNASFAYMVHDDSMAPLLRQNTYAYIEVNGLLSNKDIGLFKLNDTYLIRRLMYNKKGSFSLKAIDKNVPDINISDSDIFQIIGKVYL